MVLAKFIQNQPLALCKTGATTAIKTKAFIMKIAVVPYDGIGTEIVAEAVKVLKP